MVTAEMGTTRIGRYTNRVADKMLTPLALRMSQSRALGNLALKTSYGAGLVADFVGFKSWTMGSSLSNAAALRGFADYASLIEARNYGKPTLMDSIMPQSWRQGLTLGAWSTSEFVKWGYFAVALHVQVLTGLFYPEIAHDMSESVGGFAKDFGMSTGLAAGFTYLMLGGHHASHVLEAARTYNLERTVQETVGTKLVEKLSDGSVRFRTNTLAFWKELASLVFTGPAGKHSAVIKDGFNYRVNGTPSLNVLAAGPRFDRWVARIAGAVGLPLLATSIGLRAAGIESPEVLSILTPKAMALATIAFLGRHQDSDALFGYERKLVEERRLKAEAAAGTIKSDAGREEIDAAAKRNLATILASSNSAVYGGTDPRFSGVEVFLPIGFHNAIQGGKHTEYVDAEGNKGNTSPDLVAQEKWIILTPKQTDEVSERGFFGTLKALPVLQGQVTAEILSKPGVSGGGRENEGGVSFNGYGGGDEAAVELMMEAASKAGVRVGYKYGENMLLGLDNAADSSDMFDPESGLYTWQGRKISGDELADRYEELFYKWKHLAAFEDPFAAPESQWGFWSKLTSRLGDKMLIIGDDVLCTNPSTAHEAISRGMMNAGLVKLNQVGSFVQAWMYMELFHSRGLSTVISHRSTQPDTLPSPLEVTAALGASYRQQGRVVGAKLGGVFLSSRANLYNEMQVAREEWATGDAVTSGVGPDVRIASISAVPSPLGGGKYGLMTKMRLSNGVEIVSPIPGGLSRGEGETRLLGPKDGIPMVAQLVGNLGLVGRSLGEIGNVFDIERTLMAFDIQEAQRKGTLPAYSHDAWAQYLQEAAFKTVIGGDVSLGLGQLLMKAVALRDGIPPWLAYRQHGLALTEQIGLRFENWPDAERAFYEPIFTNSLGTTGIRG